MIQKKDGSKSTKVHRYLMPKFEIYSIKQRDVITTSGEGKAIGDASFDEIKDDIF